MSEAKATGTKLYSLLDKASHDFRPAHFTDEDLTSAKELLVAQIQAINTISSAKHALNPLQTFDTTEIFSIGQPTKLPDGRINFAILQQPQQAFFLVINPDGDLCY